MKRTWIAIVLVLCMAFSLLPFGAAAAKFTDVKEGAYYYDAVNWAVNHKPQITKGISDTTFAPNQTCTRAQVVTFLWRAIGNEEKMTITNPFVDVPTNQYYYNSAVWAFREKITTGKDAKHFSPDDPCTREQVATFLWRAMGQPTTSLTKSPFTDVQNKNAYSYTAILWAYENGITTGKTETTFAPNDPCTRGQIVTFLYRTFNVQHLLLVKVTTVNPDGSKTGYLFEYDANGLNTRVTSLDGKQWEKHIFDASGNYIKRETPAGTFDVGGQERKAEITTERDAKGRVIKETIQYSDGDKTVTVYEYDGDSDRVIAERDENGKLVTRIAYDKNGNVAKRESFMPDNQTTPYSVETYEYDKNGNVSHSHYDSNYGGSSSWSDWVYENDENGMMTKMVYTTSDGIKDTSTFKYNYTSDGRLASVVETMLDKDNVKTVTTEEFKHVELGANLAKSGHAIFPWDF